MDTSILTIGHSYQVEIIQKNKKGFTVQYDWDGLVLIGGQDLVLGKEYTYLDLQKMVECQRGPPKYRFHLVQKLDHMSFDEIEAFINDKDESLPLIEGLVFKYRSWQLNGGIHRFKWKSARYKEAHTLQQKLSKKRIYKAFVKSDETVKNLRNTISEDLYNHFDKTLEDFYHQIISTLDRIEQQIGLIDIEFYDKLDTFFDTHTWFDGKPFTKQDRSLLHKVYDVGFPKFKRDWKQVNEPKQYNKNRAFFFNNVIRI